MNSRSATGADQRGWHEGQEPGDQFLALGSVGVAALGQEHPYQRVGRALVDEARHEDVDIDRAEAPVRPIDRDDEVAVDGPKTQHQVAPGRVVEREVREEALDAAVVGLLQGRAGEGVGDVGKIDRGDLDQRQCEGVKRHIDLRITATDTFTHFVRASEGR